MTLKRDQPFILTLQNQIPDLNAQEQVFLKLGFPSAFLLYLLIFLSLNGLVGCFNQMMKDLAWIRKLKDLLDSQGLLILVRPVPRIA